MFKNLLWHPLRRTKRYFLGSKKILGQTLPLTVIVFPKNYGTHDLWLGPGEFLGYSKLPSCLKERSAITKYFLYKSP